MRRAWRAMMSMGASTAIMTTGLVGSTAAAADSTATSVRPPPTRQAAAPRAVRVATYNVCKSTCGKGRYSWLYRRGALLNQVRWTDPDVLNVQEANTTRWRGRQQLTDVRILLARLGYTVANLNLTCTKRCTRGAHIFYKPARLTLRRLPNRAMSPAGMAGLSTIAGTSFGSYQDRAVSWAFLTPKGSARTSLYVSVHLITQQTSRGESYRRAAARHLRSFATGLIARSGLRGDVPVIVSGDFNSYQRRQPNGAQAIMVHDGFIDGYAAPVRANVNYGTVNYTPKIRKYKGFPPAPYRYGRTSPARIDYVFSTVAPLRHEVVLRLTGSGRFDDRYRASDHNMVLVDLPLK
jgi:endonuclease/exonuclease/phosphatase family metal-dependent hydrolase